MKSQQYCSVCKEWLDMEVVPTGEGDEDDGVIWFRCPQCQGFLPKLSGADLKPARGPVPPPPASPRPVPVAAAAPGTDEELPWDSPADMMAARAAADGAVDDADLEFPDIAAVAAVDPLAAGLLAVGEDLADLSELADLTVDDGETEQEGPAERPLGKAGVPAEPVHEYAALLEGLDPQKAVPYRPWDNFEVGQCILHLAWEDCGVVVAKERLPGGRQVIKCYFSEAGVVRLIENAPQ